MHRRYCRPLSVACLIVLAALLQTMLQFPLTFPIQIQPQADAQPVPVVQNPLAPVPDWYLPAYDRHVIHCVPDRRRLMLRLHNKVVLAKESPSTLLEVLLPHEQAGLAREMVSPKPYIRAKARTTYVIMAAPIPKQVMDWIQTGRERREGHKPLPPEVPEAPDERKETPKVVAPLPVPLLDPTQKK